MTNWFEAFPFLCLARIARRAGVIACALNESKNAKVGLRQRALAKKLNRAGPLSAAGLSRLRSKT